MTGPRPAGRRWMLTDDDMLRKLLTSGMKQRLIAQGEGKVTMRVIVPLLIVLGALHFWDQGYKQR